MTLFCMFCGQNRPAKGGVMCKSCLAVLQVQTGVVVKTILSEDRELRRRKQGRGSTKVPLSLEN